MLKRLSGCALGLLVACGTPPAESPDPAPTEASPAEAAPGDTTEPAAEAEADPEASEDEPTQAEPGEDSAGAHSPRTIDYVMTTGGLEIVVEGVRFKPSAKPVRMGAGWGIEIEVQAKVTDDNAHSLLDPKRGPLAFAGTIERDGKTTRVTDKREGEGEKLIGPGESVKLKRRWPDSGGEKPIVAGQTVTLEVGLWGLGPDADQRRAVRDFFQIKMRAGQGKPQPVISPPPSANP